MNAVSEKITLQEWKQLDTFEAENESKDTIQGYVNKFIFMGGVYGCYSLLTGGSGWVALGGYAAMGLACRKIASVAMGYNVCQEATFFRASKANVEQYATDTLKMKDYWVKKVTLISSSTRYIGYLSGHKDTLENGHWVIHASEHKAEDCLERFTEHNYTAYKANTLLINGPSIVGSGGYPTAFQMGAGFEAGLQLLEKTDKVTHILLNLHGFGASMMAEGLLHHQFSPRLVEGMKYLAIFDCAISRLSALISHTKGPYMESIYKLAGMELDCVKAVKILDNFRIEQIIIQHKKEFTTDSSSDGVIPEEVILSHELNRKNLAHTTFLEDSKIQHNEPLPRHVKENLDKRINAFFGNYNSKTE